MNNNAIQDYLQTRKQPVPLMRIAKAVGMPTSSTKRELRALEKSGQVVSDGKRGYSLSAKRGYFQGKLNIDRHGNAWVTDGSRRIRVAREGKGEARQGDTVLYCLRLNKRMGDRMAYIQRVLQREHEIIVGQVREERGHCIVDALDVRLGSFALQENICAGSLVTVTAAGGRAKVLAVLGDGSNGLDYMRAIAIQKGIHLEFDDVVLAEASQLRREHQIRFGDRQGGALRLDLRREVVFTIDGADAKDLDDAVSIQRTATGWRLGVHIADVSEYVHRGSALDKAAYARGNSTYLPGLTLPMLPHQLSNDLCSLNPHTDKYCISALLDVDITGKLREYQFAKSVIRSKARLTYEAVQQALSGQCSFASPYISQLREMERLRETLYKLRVKNGTIDLTVPETAFELGDDGFARKVTRRRVTNAHRMIEEFMLLANKACAHLARKERLPIVFRVHPSPSQEKLVELWDFLNRAGYPGKGSDPALLQQVLRQSQESPLFSTINTVILRSMQKAVYSSQCEGHYGLGFPDYCHFTSPIRRYSDLLTHRTLSAYLCGSSLTCDAAEAAQQCTQQEVNSMLAERVADDLLRAQHMRKHLGDCFEAVITSVLNFGFFVALPNTVEGLVHIRCLEDDYYNLSDDCTRLVGEKSGKIYALGDTVTVQVAAANIYPPRVDFVLAKDASVTTPASV